MWFPFIGKTRATRDLRTIILLSLVLLVVQLFLYFDLKQEQEPQFLEVNEVITEETKTSNKKELKVFPFNPNYISLEKGYQLNLSVEEIEKLHAYRKQNKFINSISDFQRVTGVSREWLNTYERYFKFPEWVIKKQKQKKNRRKSNLEIKPTSKVVVKVNLNTASFQELQQVPVIDEAKAKTILLFRSSNEFIEPKDLYQLKGFDSLIVNEIKRYLVD